MNGRLAGKRAAEMVANDAARSSGRVRGFSPTAAQGGRFMRRMVPGRPRALGALAALAMLVALNATLAHAAAPTPNKKKARPPKIQETVGDLAYVVSTGEMVVEGVGLGIGLDNTGGDSPASQH